MHNELTSAGLEGSCASGGYNGSHSAFRVICDLFNDLLAVKFVVDTLQPNSESDHGIY